MGQQEKNLRLILAGERLSRRHNNIRHLMKSGIVVGYPGSQTSTPEMVLADIREVSGVPDATLRDLNMAAMKARHASRHN